MLLTLSRLMTVESVWRWHVIVMYLTKRFSQNTPPTDTQYLVSKNATNFTLETDWEQAICIPAITANPLAIGHGSLIKLANGIPAQCWRYLDETDPDPANHVDTIRYGVAPNDTGAVDAGMAAGEWVSQFDVATDTGLYAGLGVIDGLPIILSDTKDAAGLTAYVSATADGRVVGDWSTVTASPNAWQACINVPMFHQYMRSDGNYWRNYFFYCTTNGLTRCRVKNQGLNNTDYERTIIGPLTSGICEQPCKVIVRDDGLIAVYYQDGSVIRVACSRTQDGSSDWSTMVLGYVFRSERG